MTDRLVPSVYGTPQLGINAAENGDRVVCSPGTYNLTAALYFPNDYVVEVVSSDNNPVTCVMDAQDNDRVFSDASLPTSPGSLLKGLTFLNGNVAGFGGGASLGGAGGFVDIDNCIMGACDATAGGGGGVYIASGATVNVTNSTATDCTASTTGGGVHFPGSATAVTLRNVKILNNTAGGSGGGIYSNFDALKVINCPIDGNVSGAHGAGCYFTSLDGAWEFIGNDVTDNSCAVAAQDGGGVYMSASTGAGKFNDNYIAGNVLATDSGAYGGGLYMTGCSGIIEFKNLIFYNNAAGYMGGAYIDCTNLAISNLIAVGNTSAYNYAVAIGDSTSIKNATIADNIATAAYCGGLSIGAGNTVTVDNTILRGNTGVQYNDAGALTISYSNVEGGVAGGEDGGNNIDSDAKFTGFGGAFGYFLKDDSPSKDAGDATTPFGSTSKDFLPDDGTIDQGYHYVHGNIPPGWSRRGKRHIVEGCNAS